MANYPNMTNSPASLLKLRMSMVAGLCWLVGASSALAAQSPEEIVAGFDKRVEAMFRGESGKPLVRAEKKKPLGPGRGYSIRARLGEVLKPYEHLTLKTLITCLQ